MGYRPSSDDAAEASTLVQPLSRAPLVPESLLRKHACFIPGDNRFRAAARLRQSLWRLEQGLAAGLHRPGGSSTITPIPLGSLLQPVSAAHGLNFLSPAVYAFVRRSLVLREEGAMVNYDRLTRNLLSSEPLTYNLFVPLALNLDLATALFRRLLPAFVHQVTGIRFETSPGRYDPRYLADGTAFDAALSVITPDGEPATLFIEVKYSEGCTGPAATHRPRYDEASREVALHHDPDAPALRSTLLEQFWRLHLLAQLAARHEITPRAHLLVLCPHHNRRVCTAARLYAAELRDPAGSSSPGTVGFTALPLETFVNGLAQAGGGAEAVYLHHRYLDLGPVLDLVLSGPGAPDVEPLPRTPLLALPPPQAMPDEKASRSVRNDGAKPFAIAAEAPRRSSEQGSSPSVTTRPKRPPVARSAAKVRRRRSSSSEPSPMTATKAR